MADVSIRARLLRLFSGNVIVRNVGGKKLKVADTSNLQYLPQKQLVDRYQRLFSSGKGLSGYSDTAMVRSLRLGLFRDYESMDSDSIIASALDIYADESTMKSEYGEVLTIKTDNDNIKQILHNLFYDIINVEFNLWAWVRNMCKYGDFYLQLELDEKYGVKNVVPLSTYDVVRLENIDPENPEYIKFAIESADPNQVKSSHTQMEFENYEIAHFRLLSDSNYLPYGKAMIEGGRKTWKQLSLMEDAMLIHRIMRAPEKRVFKIDIGNIPPNEVDNYMNQIINKMKKAPVVEADTGDYNLKYNMQNITEDFFLPVRGGDSGTQIDSLPGLSYEAVEDIEYLRDKLMAALKVPRAFLGYEEAVGCVVPETEIPLLSGEIKTVKEIIEDYENGIKHYTYSIDSKTNMIVPGEIEWAGYTSKNAKLVRVNLDNGKYIDCTPDHRFLTRDGEWIEAQYLEKNQSLMPLYLDETTQKNKNGYTTVYHPGTKKYQEVHRLVAEHYDMVEAGSGKVVHHLDFQKKNNYPENFDCSMDYYEHRKYHSKLTEKTINSPENIVKRVKEQKKNNHFETAGRLGGLKSADKLVKWLKENGPWNKGKLSGETKKCVECNKEFYTEPHRNSEKCCSSECSTKYYTGDKRYNTKFIKK
ncbi:MAG: portal protein [Pelagibacteraceae bacterium]|nr:portal protein [Pelagibacteraceae bacterium]